MTAQKHSLILAGRAFALVSVAALAGAFACSKDGDDGIDSGFGANGSVAGGNGMGGLVGSAGMTTGIPTLPTGGSTSGTAGGNGMISADAACATGMAKADLTPVNMFIQFDRSGSMNDDNKWPQAAQALNAFFADAATAGLRVALRFFPHDQPMAGCTGGNNGACNVQACSVPLVNLAEVLATPAPTDTHEAALLAAVMNSAPPPDGMGGGNMSGGTPLYPALAGALQWAQANQMATPTEKTVVVLVTDGEPNGCEEDIDEIAGLAATAWANGAGIPTYAIGIAGASEDQMNQIAEAGGTEQAFFAGNTMTAQQDLINALNAIRGSVLECTFDMPQGQNVDPEKININYTASSGMVELIGRTTDAANCMNGGWYYDNNTAPTQISLCQATCDRITADAAARIDVLLGCASEPVVPPR